MKRPVLAPGISFSLGPTLWTPVNPSSWHPRQILVGQVRILAIATQPFICIHHTQGPFEWDLRTSSAYSSFWARFIFVPQETMTALLFLSVELLATHKEQDICLCGSNFPLNSFCSYCIQWISSTFEIYL